MAEELGQKNGGGADISPRGGGVVRLAQGAGWRSPGPLTFPTLTRNVRFSSTSSRLSSPCFASMSSPSGVNRLVLLSCRRALVSLDRTSSQNPSLEQSPKPEIELLPSLAPVQKRFEGVEDEEAGHTGDYMENDYRRVSNKPPPNLLSHLQIRNPKDICNTESGLQRIPNPCHRAEPKDCFPKP
nr:hypothetical protein Itr_chr13CG21930 [Ipomoea trifida]